MAEIEEKDIERIFIISSDDWRNITQSFRLLDTVKSLNSLKDDGKVKNILAKKAIYQRDIDSLDRRFILVSLSVNGNFTIIEGNKRALALLSMNELVGNQIYLGVSSKIRNYVWARYSL